MDLCEDCAAPLQEYMVLGESVSVGRGPTSSGPRRKPDAVLRMKVRTPEEIDKIVAEEAKES